ncbi:hypothetical protein BP6252_11610 [Coleophoma cylindrospora]|uniref:Uncharacterized protein n=1 Tax=Coleophoma cylindrospora TaxID=1849047 RepID=A0A3D8QKA2_9HELO|nr:hypothetical protein BP6252_11610 [Coleophoma cylindrospora]
MWQPVGQHPPLRGIGRQRTWTWSHAADDGLGGLRFQSRIFRSERRWMTGASPLCLPASAIASALPCPSLDGGQDKDRRPNRVISMRRRRLAELPASGGGGRQHRAGKRKGRSRPRVFGVASALVANGRHKLSLAGHTHTRRLSFALAHWLALAPRPATEAIGQWADCVRPDRRRSKVQAKERAGGWMRIEPLSHKRHTSVGPVFARVRTTAACPTATAPTVLGAIRSSNLRRHLHQTSVLYTESPIIPPATAHGPRSRRQRCKAAGSFVMHGPSRGRSPIEHAGVIAQPHHLASALLSKLHMRAWDYAECGYVRGAPGHLEKKRRRSVKGSIAMHELPDRMPHRIAAAPVMRGFNLPPKHLPVHVSHLPKVKSIPS